MSGRLLTVALLLGAGYLLLRQDQEMAADGTNTGDDGGNQDAAVPGWISGYDLGTGGALVPAGSDGYSAVGVTYDAMGNVAGFDLSDVAYWGDTVWTESKIPAQYLQLIRNAESANGMPRNLLARQLWQESRYNPQAVNTNSGAQGIAQFMPATAQSLGIDPFDAPSAIAAAGRYMRQLYRSTGTWVLALAAYNWGIGNVQRKGLMNAPAETRNYYKQILADIGMPATTA